MVSISGNATGGRGCLREAREEVAEIGSTAKGSTRPGREDVEEGVAESGAIAARK